MGSGYKIFVIVNGINELKTKMSLISNVFINFKGTQMSRWKTGISIGEKTSITYTKVKYKNDKNIKVK